jgi:hippurate hydrolase
MLLGAARYLASARDFAGTVHFIFQPAEEAGTGAPAMIADGLFDRFPCDSVYGLHNSPGLPVGKFATREGPILAGSDFWGVTFTGTGGHGGSSPHLATDATVVLGHFLLGVQTILPRNLHPTESAALSVGHVSGGAYNSPNVMPSKIVVRGTARYFRTEVQAVIRRRLEELAKTLHVGNLFCLMHVGDMPREKCMYSTKLFAEKVMPKLRNVFPEYADDERFWCHPIKQVKPGSLPVDHEIRAMAIS